MDYTGTEVLAVAQMRLADRPVSGVFYRIISKNAVSKDSGMELSKGSCQQSRRINGLNQIRCHRYICPCFGENRT